MRNVTITEQINRIAFDTLTEDQFNFLVERALKSVRKSTGERKPTKVQKENEGIKAQMREVLADSEGMTATAVGKAVDISVQKASALLKQMVDSGEVVKAKDGKATIFTVA